MFPRRWNGCELMRRNYSQLLFVKFECLDLDADIYTINTRLA
jgi:hypothetical protein